MKSDTSQKPNNLLPIRVVAERTSLSRATIYRLVVDGKFPKPIPVTEARKAWVDEDVTQWIRSRIDTARSGHRAA